MHLEAITSKQKKIFERLRNFSEYYLVGGTALSLQIGHRISIDFDLFSEKEIPRDLLSKVEKVFRNFKIKVEINNPEQLTIRAGGTKIDFVKYSFPLILPLIKFQGINILRIPEIAAMKARVLGRRPEFKDYIDLYFILKKKHFILKEIIDFAERKYKDEFNTRLFLEQLIYLEDVKTVKIYFLKEKVSKNQIQKFFEKEIQKIKL